MARTRLRQQLLAIVAMTCSLAALVAMLDPDRVAALMGEFPVGVSGYSQFYAYHVGTRFAIAVLALLAARRANQPVLGDVTALFILAQPAGRLTAALQLGLPQGFIVAISGAELAVGIALLALRPRERR